MQPEGAHLPDVADLVERLAIRTTADFDVLYRAAQHVLTEEQARREAGLEPASLDILVERAVRVVTEGVPLPSPFPESAPTPPAPGHLDLGLEFGRPSEPGGGGAAVPTFASAPSRASRRNLIILGVVLGVVLAATAGVYVFLGLPTRARSGMPPSPRLAPTTAPAEEPSEPPAIGAAATEPPAEPPTAVAGTAQATPAETPKPPPTAPPTARPAPAAAPARPDVFATRDWKGAPYFAVHFSSYRERDKAVRDAAVLAGRLGLPARALEADLGTDGTWYRVMVGDFPTREDAVRFHDELAARRTPDLGHVFEVVSAP